MNLGDYAYLMAMQQGEPQPPQEGGMPMPSPSPPPPMNNPFKSGVSLAMQAARESMGMPNLEQNRRRAIGSGFMALGNALQTPSENGFGGIAKSLGSGMNAVMQKREAQQQQEQQMNAMIYAEAIRQKELEEKRKTDLEESERDRLFKGNLQDKDWEKRMALHESELGETRRAHDLAHLDRQDAIRSRSGVASIGEPGMGLYGVEYVPFTDKTQKKKFYEKHDKLLDSYDANKKAIESANGLDEIFEKYPDISNSFLNFLTTGKDEKLSGWQSLVREYSPFVDQEKLSAIERAQKLSSDLKLDVILDMKGNKGTDNAKEIIKQTIASGKSLPETAKFVNDKIRKRASNNIKKTKIYEDAASKGLFARITDLDDEEMSGDNSMQTSSNSQVDEATKNAAREELKRRGINK